LAHWGLLGQIKKLASNATMKDEEMKKKIGEKMWIRNRCIFSETSFGILRNAYTEIKI
jgi:hypothetical protein